MPEGGQQITVNAGFLLDVPGVPIDASVEGNERRIRKANAYTLDKDKPSATIVPVEHPRTGPPILIKDSTADAFRQQLLRLLALARAITSKKVPDDFARQLAGVTPVSGSGVGQAMTGQT